ncbi:MAG: PfkB family carbohydrate kinase [Candidatus Thorarchaeota archaeon]|jgi:sugar/nucleoside kinase (ribokinase family)
MYDIVVIGNPTFHNGRLSGPSVYSAATAAQIGFENLAIVSSVGNNMADKFIQGVATLGIPEYYIIDANDRGAVELRSPTLDRKMSVLGIPDKIGIRSIPEEFLRTRVILLSPSLQEINAEFVEWICSSTDAHVFLDPQLRGLTSDGRLEVIREFSVVEKTQSYLDVIKPNQLESEWITGESDPYLAAELIVEWASEACVITLGENGSLVYDGKDFNILPSYPVEEVDSVGAGAVYLAAFASQLIAEKTLTDCAVYATSVASLKVENQGIEFSIDDTEIARRNEKIASSVETR